MNAIGMEALTGYLVPKLRRELRRKPDGTLTDTTARMDAYDTAGVLLVCYLNELKSALVETQQRLAQLARLVAECELGHQARETLATHRGVNDTGQNDQCAIATEFLELAQPKWLLRLLTVLTVAGLLLTGAADACGVGYAMWQRSLDALGNFQGNIIVLVGLSLFTLFIYWGMGLLWKHPRPHARYAAAALYLFVVTVLTFVLWPDESARARELWDTAHQATGNVFEVSNAAAPQAPFPFKLLVVTLWALVYTAAGLLFIWCKYRCAFYMDQWRIRSAAQKKLDQAEAAGATSADADRLADWIVYVEGNLYPIGRHLVRIAHDRETATETTRLNECLAKATRITTSTASKALLLAEAEKIDTWLQGSMLPEDDNAAADNSRTTDEPEPVAKIQKRKAATVMALLFIAGSAVFSVPPAQAESSSQLCAAAPSFQLYVDVSSSSPVASPSFINAVLPVIESRIRALPPCSWVDVVTMGDSRIMPDMRPVLVLNRTVPGKGATKDDIVRGIRQLLAGMPNRVKNNAQNRSELIGAMTEAAKNVNGHAKARNILILLTDGVEESPFANCARGPCRLPAPTFKLPPNTEVALYGCGAGLPSDKALRLCEIWTRWFKLAGNQADVRRIVLGAL